MQVHVYPVLYFFHIIRQYSWLIIFSQAFRLLGADQDWGNGDKTVISSGTTAHWNGNISEKDITYDRNGNVTGLKRYMANGIHDELVFTHAGNLVTQWTDVYNTDNGYYDYDGNGNRIHDGHANLDYSYNILNLSQSVTNAMNQSITYKYLADGTKISVMNGAGEGKEYRGTFIYDRHSAEGCDWAELSSIAWEEGRIVVEPGNDVGVDSLVVDSLYVEDFPIEGEEIVVDSTAVVPFYLHDLWYVKDHLGSVRSVVLLGEDYSATAALVEQNDYYPFGTRIAGTAGAASDSLDYANRDRFCGKEEQDFSPSLNLRLLDFSARYYDPFTCRWTTQDPLAEKYYSLSPYTYCANNPQNMADPEGKSTCVIQTSDSTFVVTSLGNVNDGDNSIYIVKQDKNGKWVKHGVLGRTATPYSFYNSDDGLWAEGSIININDASGNYFINELVLSNVPLGDYMEKARTGEEYDFKSTGGSPGVKGIDPYRGMPLGDSGDVFMSARDAGNIVAGYYAGSNGFPWWMSRAVFDYYQGGREGPGTVSAEKLGWKYGNSIEEKGKRLRQSLPSIKGFLYKGGFKR